MKTFIVEVPCTITDRYFVTAENEEHAKRKMASGCGGPSGMREHTKGRVGDYRYDGPSDDEPETHWDRAEVISEVQE